MTFDNQRVDYYSAGEYWVVKSDAIWIQGRYLPTPYTGDRGVTKAIAIGGPFLRSSTGREHTLVIHTDDARWEVPSLLTKSQILHAFPSDFRHDDPAVHATYTHAQRGLDEMPGDESWCDKIVHVFLPLGVIIHIHRWIDGKNSSEAYMNLIIDMNPTPGQDGHCGNFNGDGTDDGNDAVSARIGRRVSNAQLLFHYQTVPEGEIATA